MPKINNKWFKEAISASKYKSQRQLAFKMRDEKGKPYDPSFITKIFKGERRLQVDEAKQMADLLGVSLDTVLRHAGVEGKIQSGNQLAIAGYINAKGEVTLDRLKGEFVEAPPHTPVDALALRIMAKNSSYDGWVIFTEKPRPLTADKLGRLCVVCLKSSLPLMAHVSRGYKPNTVNLQTEFCQSPTSFENRSVEWVAMVLWIATA